MKCMSRKEVCTSQNYEELTCDVLVIEIVAVNLLCICGFFLLI